MVAEADALRAVALGAEAAGADPQATRIRIAEIVSGLRMLVRTPS
jgi:hypothetical protein